MRGRTVAGAAAVLVALAPIGATEARGAHARPHAMVVYGYPYADHCPGAGVADRVDRWGMYECNCTSYVAWALQANAQRIDWFVPGAMDAWNWPHVAALAGIRTGSVPRRGSVAVWPKLSPPFGHVAYVTAVARDGTFAVAEYNLTTAAGFEPFLFDTRTHVSARGARFIYVPPA